MRMRKRRKQVGKLLAVVLLLLLLLSGCTKVCSFCGKPAVFYDQCRIHGREVVVCPFCQVW